jgi:hypothetical protein
MFKFRCAGAAAAVAVVAAFAVPLAAHAQPRQAADATAFSSATSVGVHNAYDKAKYPYFADALDSGASLLEVDVWTNDFGGGWHVSHDNPLGNDNNCENASSPGDLRVKPTDQSFDGCLADMRAWHDAHPGHRPIVVKIEMKDGFNADSGRGPSDFDSLVSSKLGDAVFRPDDLIGSAATLDDAVQANGWPSRDAMAGKFVFELIPGTVEEQDPFDTLWTDQEYATHLRDLQAAGNLGQAQAFPAVHNPQAGDPRDRYDDTSLRPWFVVFDGDAATYLNNGIDTSWYDDRHYLLIMTDGENVSPPIDGTNPSEADATARVQLLAQDHASIVTADWYPLPSVLSLVVPRG